MTRNIVETPIEDLGPDWIDVAMEVTTGDGSVAGFRLARYERTTRDGEPLWVLFSAGAPWRTEVGPGGKIWRVPQEPASVSATGGFGPPPPQEARWGVTAPTAAPRSPQSWVTPSSAGPR